MELNIGLNPCFNGILKYLNLTHFQINHIRLNPCFNGILKYTSRAYQTRSFYVLILVLMEY